jgi:hypothetical protein
MITIAEVIEQCAHFADAQRIDAIRNRDFAEATLCKEIANDIRDLAAKYEGCIVAEGEASAHRWLVRHNDVDGWVVGHNEPPPYAIEQQPLYRAKEPTK